MNCPKLCPWGGILFVTVFQDDPSRAAMRSCLLLAGSSLLAKPILPQRIFDTHGKKILRLVGQTADPSQDCGYKAYTRFLISPLFSSPPISSGPSYCLSPTTSQRTRKSKRALPKN